MLQFDATRLFKLRGIKKPYAFLCKQGLSHHIAQRLAAGSVNTLKLGYLETVCMALHCTPNDLMCWTPDEQYCYQQVRMYIFWQVGMYRKWKIAMYIFRFKISLKNGFSVLHSITISFKFYDFTSVEYSVQ